MAETVGKGTVEKWISGRALKEYKLIAEEDGIVHTSEENCMDDCIEWLENEFVYGSIELLYENTPKQFATFIKACKDIWEGK